MDVAFRDATLKGPLWEDVSRKLAELGYSRSAKKCKEKFENVHKYYKRTKEGRAGRQDGKSYRFFSQLEALHSTATSNVSAAPATPLTAVIATTTNTTTFPNTNTVSPATNLIVAPISIGIGTSNPMPVSSVRIPSASPSTMGASPMFPPDLSSGMITAPSGSAAATAPAAAPTHTALGISFSSNTSSSSSGSDDDEQEDEDILQGSRPTQIAVASSSNETGDGEAGGDAAKVSRDHREERTRQDDQRRGLEETGDGQTVREHDLMAQERALSASRDAAIIAFLQKITGQTIQLPPPVTIPAVPPPAPPAPVPPPAHQHNTITTINHNHNHNNNNNTNIIIIIINNSTFTITTNLKWWWELRVELIEVAQNGSSCINKLEERTGLQVPRGRTKGSSLGRISAGMQQMGYKRSAKRCKEKWENINKYFKKVKESNKKRPEDAKTCPYFHQLDALYRKKLLGSTSGSGGSGGSTYVNPNRPEEQQQQQPPPQHESAKLDPIPTPYSQDRGDVPAIMPPPITTSQATESENKNGGSSDEQTNNGGLPGSLFGEGSSTPGGGAKKPEDIVKDQQGRQQVIVDDYDNVEELDSDNLDQEEEGEDDDEVEESEEERKMGFKIEFQSRTRAPLTGEETGHPPSWLWFNSLGGG
ncbi:Trihelix transcription factor GT-2 [Vitis vinifera]|uniref:Trihelix transcription factor GT-2 n=1 Tax=Vitis vinifera TaxID=29760 RepID=A0A438EG61_VITVI|nr:Trihelix transcription factor GT-2 [Vitis vinifera]